MKKGLFIVSVLAAALLTSCNNKLQQPENITVNPNPLTVVGGKITADINGTFPEKKFVKKGVLTVTPVLKYNGTETVGEPVVYVGEKAKENGKTVNYKAGGAYKQTFSCVYTPDMAQAELYLRFNAVVGKKTIEIPDLKVADGVVATAQLATACDNKAAVTPDKFQRIIQEIQEADIKFLINQANLRYSETKSSKIADLKSAILDANAAENKEINKIEVAGYASPDGKETQNAKLAEQRQAVAQKFLQRELKKAKIQTGVESNITAEDWEGFQTLMENSNIQDKDLVLRVLSMYSDPEEREAQIKNLSTVYKTIADEILPALRRSRLILTTDLIGKSDDEIQSLVATDPAQLSVDELLYAATLTNDKNEKARIYKKGIELYGNDYRTHNNLGMIYFEQGNVAEARRCYAKALEIEPNNPDVNYNAAVAAMAENDLDKANVYLGKAAGTSANLSAAMGTYYTMRGDYNNAQRSYGNSATNNAAVQQILDENYAGARQTLEKVQNPNATTAYLLAIVGARTNDRQAVYSNLQTAISRDASMKAKAAKDIEFSKFANDDQFNAIVK